MITYSENNTQKKVESVSYDSSKYAIKSGSIKSVGDTFTEGGNAITNLVFKYNIDDDGMIFRSTNDIADTTGNVGIGGFNINSIAGGAVTFQQVTDRKSVV